MDHLLFRDLRYSANGSGQEDFSKSLIIMCFYCFLYHSPWWKVITLLWTNCYSYNTVVLEKMKMLKMLWLDRLWTIQVIRKADLSFQLNCEIIIHNLLYVHCIIIQFDHIMDVLRKCIHHNRKNCDNVQYW